MEVSSVAAFLKYRAAPNKWFQAFCVAILVLVIYLLTSKGSTPYDHFVRLADAMMDGRLYLENPPSWLELIRIEDKGYVINPPAPVIFVFPWVAIWGLSTNQAIISMLVGAAAIGLFWVAATQMGWSLRFKAAITALLAFGTNFWWVTTEGSVWMLAHVSAVFFLMAALVETTGRNRPWLVGILVGLAGLSRLPTFLAFPFFAYTVGAGSADRRIMIHRLVWFGLALGVMGGLYLLYTYGEYGALTIGYERGHYMDEPWFAEGLFDLSYIPRHLEAIFFFTPVRVDEFPYFKPSYMGLGLFLTTPALLYMFRARLNNRLVLAALAGLVLIAIPIVTYGATGWLQFGYRFGLDLLPFMAILVASGMHYRLDRLKVAAIVLSCAICLWGTLSFHKFDWVA
jgi:hypothetical protein